ncbi:MAG: LPXTG cell wall anchor domain-containing protein [Actinomycetota bacterium]
MRRIAVTMGVVALLASVAGPASAQYPPGAAQIFLSDVSGACPGGTITISGSGWIPIEPAVLINFDGEEITRVFPDEQGDISVTVTLPDAAPGAHTITAIQFIAADEPDVIEASATFTCVGPPGLAVTGAGIQVWMLLVLGLVVAGAASLVVGRRRAKV